MGGGGLGEVVKAVSDCVMGEQRDWCYETIEGEGVIPIPFVGVGHLAPIQSSVAKNRTMASCVNSGPLSLSSLSPHAAVLSSVCLRCV